MENLVKDGYPVDSGQDVVCLQMEDYPRNLTEFEARFSSEETCREYLFRLRWPDGFRFGLRL